MLPKINTLYNQFSEFPSLDELFFLFWKMAEHNNSLPKGERERQVVNASYSPIKYLYNNWKDKMFF